MGMDYEVIQPNGELRSEARRLLRGVWGQMILAVFVYTFTTTFWFSVADRLRSRVMDSFEDAYKEEVLRRHEERLSQLKPLEDELPKEETSVAESDLSGADSSESESDDSKSLVDAVSASLAKDWSWKVLKTLFWGVALVLLLCLVGFILVGPFTLGIAGYFLKRVREKEIAIGDLFDGFKRFVPSFLLYLCMIIFLVFWTLMLIVPALIKGFSYSMAFYIMYDNPGMGPLKAIKESRVMMDGYKWKLFKLMLSFIGWFILAMVPAVIVGYVQMGIVGESDLIGWILFDLLSLYSVGFFVLTPYMGLALASFYENLKRSREATLAGVTGAAELRRENYGI